MLAVNIKNNCIALFGTSADPPTLGHKALLEELSKIFPLVITWASDNPLKQHVASLEIRYKLLDALIKDIGISTIQINQTITSPRTILTVQKARENWPEADLTFIIGSDLIQQMLSWENINHLFSQIKFGVVPREGWSIEPETINQLRSMGAKIQILPLKIPQSSSSTLRNKPIIAKIPQVLLPLILEQNLYGITNLKS